jgi:hypothetical protein
MRVVGVGLGFGWVGALVERLWWCLAGREGMGLFEAAVADERLLIEPMEVLQFLVLEPNSRAWDDMSECRGVGSGFELGLRFRYACITVRFSSSSSSPFLCKPPHGAINL